MIDYDKALKDLIAYIEYPSDPVHQYSMKDACICRQCVLARAKELLQLGDIKW